MIITHGDAATYSPRTGDSYAITVVFNSGELVQSTTGAYATAWAPLPSWTGGEPVKGDTISISGVSYLVDDIEKDSMGGRLLKLLVRKFNT